jgi:hypothetical protein
MRFCAVAGAVHEPKSKRAYVDLALKLARSGDYGGWRQIEKELESQGSRPRADGSTWMSKIVLKGFARRHERLARMPNREKHPTDEQQKAKALSRRDDEGGAQAQTALDLWNSKHEERPCDLKLSAKCATHTATGSACLRPKP